MADYFNVGSFRDKPSWHGREINSGGIFTGQTTIIEQMEKSQMLYDVHKVGASYTLPNGTTIQDDGRFALLREPTTWDDDWKRLRIVGNRYSPIQNSDIARILEPVQRDWPLEGLGVLKGGKIIFVELKLDPFDVGGNENEKHLTYLLVSNDHTQNSVYFGTTVVRVVCWNTYSASLAKDAKTLRAIPHSTDVDMELTFRTALIEHTIKARKEQHEVLNKMFSTPISKSGFADIVEAAFPLPIKGRRMRLMEDVPETMIQEGVILDVAKIAEKETENYQVSVERVEKMRSAVADNYIRFNDEQPYTAGTVYAAFNAVTETTNHSELYIGSVDKGMVQLFFGQRNLSNKRTYEMAVSLI